jgi:hypothetical protein
MPSDNNPQERSDIPERTWDLYFCIHCLAISVILLMRSIIMVNFKEKYDTNQDSSLSLSNYHDQIIN